MKAEQLTLLRKAVMQEAQRLYALGFNAEASNLENAWLALRVSLEDSRREFDILEGACDFWQDEAIRLGYNQGE